ncbi:hypothetical protein [Nonomuraea soli]|uniref:Uncharacterized protein n=1 Tax=Nonomuraea soli TaxID=1032476 RepID=A0A7W0CSS2_9ACTN|nr:hypothetical protein [Nonomuraea soli]MBA2896653.1 hypothetical protein [Nonomuraea soli]
MPISWLGWDGEHVFGLGRHPPRRFVAAACRLHRDVGVQPSQALGPAPAAQVLTEVWHTWAVRLPAAPSPAHCQGPAEPGWRIRWGKPVHATTPGAFPITALFVA